MIKNEILKIVKENFKKNILEPVLNSLDDDMCYSDEISERFDFEEFDKTGLLLPREIVKIKTELNVNDLRKIGCIQNYEKEEIREFIKDILKVEILNIYDYKNYDQEEYLLWRDWNADGNYKMFTNLDNKKIMIIDSGYQTDCLILFNIDDFKGEN